jgi:hypothetical protein
MSLSVSSTFRISQKTCSFYPEDDSDNESDDSDDSDGTVEQDAINFVDIASRPSIIECDIHPSQLINAGNFQRQPIMIAIIEDDFELFVNILDLYKHSPRHIDYPTNILDQIISRDRVDMLDEYIRRTGLGIKIQETTESGEEAPPVVNDKNRVYLGLSVHGKKRTDLAKHNDPNASQAEVKAVIPLLWQAVSNGATKLMDYLLGDRPLAAYKFYASSNSSDVAKLLKRTPDLAKVLPEWLGWTVSPLGESPLTAAIVSTGKKLDIVKFLFEKSPRLMASTLHERQVLFVIDLVA